MELVFGSTRPHEPSEITIGAPTHPLQKPGGWSSIVFSLETLSNKSERSLTSAPVISAR